jgi:hypothetical protein
VGALALALLVAASASAWAQTTDEQPLRGSIAPADGGDGTATSTTQDGDQPAPAKRQRPTRAPSAGIVPGVAPLGGLGDEPQGSRPDQPLGGIGDAPPTDPREAIEDQVASDEGEVGEVLEEELGITAPTRDETEPLQVHSALLPEPHDLDPYLPIGIRIGTFLLYPEVEFGTILTNNVLGTRFDTHGDVAAEVVPKLRLQSDWSRHSFSAEVNADRSWYRNFPTQDDRIYQILLRGRIDVTERTHIGGEAETSQTQTGRNSVSLTDIDGNQINLHEEHATASVDHTFNRLTLKLAGTIADYNYDNIVDPTLVGPVPFVDIRDYRETVGTLRSTYEFQSSWAGFVETSVNERTYKQPINSADLRRGSSGTVILGGLNLRLAGTLFGEISAGWGQQQAIDEAFEPVSGALINADLIWLPSPMTKVEFLARSEIDETTLVDSLGAIDRFFELSLQHAFWRYLVLGAFASYEVADFVGNPEVDQRTKGGVTAEYYFNPVLSLYGRYEHTDFISTDSASNFVEDEVRLGMKLRR